MRIIALLLFGSLLACVPACTQQKGKPDLSLSESRKIPPLPPKGVSVKTKGRHATVTWEPIPLENIVGYKVYRKVDNSKFESVGEVKNPPFVDESRPAGEVSYGVSAINSYQVESDLATPSKK